MKLLKFEFSRSMSLHLSPLYLLQLLLVTPLLALLVSDFRLASGLSYANYTDPILIGALLGTMVGIQVMSGAKNSLVGDIWVILERRPTLQVVQVFMAWLPINLLQGFFFLILLSLFEGAPFSFWLFFKFLCGFALGTPNGLCISMLSRLWPSVSIYAGITFIVSLVFIKSVALSNPFHFDSIVMLVLAIYLSFVSLVFFGVGHICKDKL